MHQYDKFKTGYEQTTFDWFVLFDRYTEINSKILKNFVYTIYTYPVLTIRQLLPKLKDRVNADMRVGFIYRIPCLDCDKYILAKLVDALSLKPDYLNIKRT